MAQSPFAHPRTRLPWILVYVSLLHATQGLLILRAGYIPLITPFALFVSWHIPAWALGATLLASATLAALLIVHPRMTPWYGLLLFPQQFCLLVTAMSALIAIYHGSYGDGVVRPRYFIAMDQLPAILSGLIHTVAMIDVLTQHLPFRWPWRRHPHA